VYSLTFALLDKGSTEYFLFCEILNGKNLLTTDLIWQDACRNAKKNGVIAVELNANEENLCKHIAIARSDLQRELSGLDQHLYDADLLRCSTLVAKYPAVYDGLRIPAGLEIVDVKTLLDS